MIYPPQVVIELRGLSACSRVRFDLTHTLVSERLHPVSRDRDRLWSCRSEGV